ncbi:hypothetical protein C0Q70_09618 [Pomacea canaliculata]|uniref:Uncharacterized protein n=1 Tax=Pomacea canaliculata TaxID=400727 RepID=A0A2T7PAA5_POMCA|nr:hypothetical protein C0Q70_09618 [Pomacea canaliculata]
MLDEDLPEVDSHLPVNISKQKAADGNAHTADEVETSTPKEEVVTPSNIELSTKDMPEVDAKLKTKASSRQNAVEGDSTDSVEEHVASSNSEVNKKDLGVQSPEVRQAVEENLGVTQNSKPKQGSDKKETKKTTVGAGKGDTSKTKKAKQTTKKKDVSFKAADSGAKGRQAVDDDLPEEVRNFKPTYLKTVTAKKIFADGRRIPPIELLPQKETNSSVRVFLFDEFLSEAECDGLRRAHDKHVQELKSQTPILCFDSITTLRKHLKNAKKKVKVSPNDFVEGTRCVNSTFSRQLGEWLKANWSYSTAFYPGESPFSSVFASRVNRSMGLNPENGGKFQITSYPTGKGRYYYENFFSLGKRPPAPSLPKRDEGQPRVSCDEYDNGSCRWYDEWNNDHLLDFGQFTRI